MNANYQDFELRTLFGDFFRPGLTMSGFAQPAAAVPPVDGTYVFSASPTREILMFLDEPDHSALFLSGPTGSGKTSGIMQVAARLNWPVTSVTCRSRLEFSDLVGHHTLVSPAPGESPVMKFQYGPLAKSLAFGHILILNEVDLCDPGELSGLNDVLEGRPLVVETNGGQVIRPHEKFRVVVTGNSCGNGDESGLYAGVQTQNLAAMDRYRTVLVDYPKPEVEEAILAKVCPEVGVLAPLMVQFANKIRACFKGESPEQRLSVTLSTRKIVQWAKLARRYQGAACPLKESLELLLLNRCVPSERFAIDTMGKIIFNDGWKTDSENA